MRGLLVGALALGACRRPALAVADDVGPVVTSEVSAKRAWPAPPPKAHSDAFVRSLLGMVRSATEAGFVEIEGTGLNQHGWWGAMTSLQPYLAGVRHGVVTLVPSEPRTDVVVHQFPPTTSVTAWETCAFMLVRVGVGVGATPAEIVERTARGTLVQTWASGDERPPMLPMHGWASEFSTAPALPFTDVVSARGRIDAWVDGEHVFFVLAKANAQIKFPDCHPTQWLRASSP